MNLSSAAFVFIALIQISHMTAVEASGDPEVLLVTAKAVKATKIKDNSRPGYLVVPDTYQVLLDNVRIAQGSRHSLGKSLMVELDANQVGQLLGATQIFLLLELSSAKPKVLYWEETKSLACLPDEFVIPAYRDAYIANPFGDEGYSCTFLRGQYMPPPEQP